MEIDHRKYTLLFSEQFESFLKASKIENLSRNFITKVSSFLRKTKYTTQKPLA